MMHLRVQFGDRSYTAQLDRPISIAIPQRFDGSEPNFFGAPKAAAQPLTAGGFVGATTQGGSCNVSVVQIVPHCNGTHTECVGHITDTKVSVADVLAPALCTALLISVTLQVGSCDDTYPMKTAEDRVITRAEITAALQPFHDFKCEALIVRTLPNLVEKTNQRYQTDADAPYFTVDAMAAIIAKGIQHLLVDVPSVDRMHDNGALTNHRMVWHLGAGDHRATGANRKTITELIYVADSVPDGLYVLDLQIPAWHLDAVPSQPVLFPLEPS